MGDPSILAVIPSGFSSPYHVYPEHFLPASTGAFFCSVVSSCFASLSLLRSTKSYSRVSYLVGSAPSSPGNFFSLFFWAESLFKRLVTLSLTVLAVKWNLSGGFEAGATFCHEVPHSRLPTKSD